MLIYCLFISMILLLLAIDHWRFVAAQNGRQFESRTLSDKMPSVGLLLACSLTFMFSAFRFQVGWDYEAYYDTIRYNIVTNIVSGQEYATIALIELAKKLEMTNVFFAVNAFLCMFFMYKAIRNYSVDRALSIVLFICFPLFFLNSLSVIRFFTALVITFYAFRFIVNRQFLKYALSVFVASLFHQSAWIALLFYAVRFFKLKTWTLAIVLGLLPILATIVNRFVLQYFPKYAVYTEATAVQEGTKAVVFFILIAIILLLFRKYVTHEDEVASLYCRLFLVGIVIYCMFYSQGTMGHRLSLYGTIYVLYVVPKLFTLIKETMLRTLLKYLFYVGLVVIFLYTVYTGAATYIPYETIFH